jgi:predicted TIM-barrel enzyme/DNA-binding NtrC family response regulator
LKTSLSRLRGELAVRTGDQRHFLVGAAIGTGLAAQSAVRGGADFLLALSAGRMRCIGEPSVAAMLPLRECNGLVMSFARAEILPRATVPVFFGAASFDPRLDLAALVDDIVNAGFAGVTNFPTAILIDGVYRQFLERVGLGFERELKLLSLAKARGLMTLAYAHTREEAVAAARCGADIVNIDLGWNKGGVLGVDTFVRIEEAALTAHTIARAVRAAAPTTICMVEGGPIVGPKQLEELCEIARVDGYLGGSTIDRVPSESAIEVVTAAFKAIGALHQRIDGLERRMDRRSFPRCLWGHSAAIENARASFARLATTQHAVTIIGESGTGRREVARALHALSARKSRDLVSVPCHDRLSDRTRLDLFGCMAGAHPTVAKNRLGWLEIAKGSTILLDGIDDLPIDVQRNLVEAVETGRFWRLGSEAPGVLDVRFLAISRHELDEARGPAFDKRFAEWLGCFVIRLPPLRERPEDLPTLIDETLRMIEARTNSPRKSLDASAFRTLAAYHWPGNLRELTSVLEQAALNCASDVIGTEHLPRLGVERGPEPASRFESEKAWILDALKRNRYRRGRTADHLGISRKTLYNKMRLYGLSPLAVVDPATADTRTQASARRHRLS